MEATEKVLVVVEVVEVVEGRATVEPPVEWLRGGWCG